MKELLKKKYTDLAFRISIIIKGIDAVLEIIVSFLIFFVTQDFVIHIATRVTRDELTEDPKDLIANYLLNAAHNLSVSTQMFAFIYLLIHGVVKLLLVVALLKKKLWAYPVSLIIFTFLLFTKFIGIHIRIPYC